MIKQASLADKEQIMRMLSDYRNHSPLEFQKTSPMTHAERIVDAVLKDAGVCFVAEKEGHIHGMILAVYNNNIWCPEVIAMHELAYWVDPDHRGSTSAHRLLLSYINYGNELKKQGKIEYFTLSKMSTSPDLDYGRFGFNKLEEMWRI